MLLNKIEKDGVVSAQYDSSNILASKWEGQNLTIFFKHGASYTYHNVSKTDYVRFEIAESQGAVLNSKIKAYSFTKNDAVDATQILKEISSSKLDMFKRFEEGFVSKMKEVVDSYEETKSIDKTSFISLGEMFKKYNEIINPKN